MLHVAHLSRQLSAAACGLVLLAACTGDPAPDAADGRTAAPRQAGWLAELPERPVTASVGDSVWAVVPRPGSGAAELAVYRVAAVAGATATLVDDIGNRYEEVPGALVHALAGAVGELAPGAPVLADRWGAHRVVGRVVEAAADGAVVAYDWNGETVREPLSVAVPLPAAGDSLTLRPLVYTAEDGARRLGLGVAEDEARVWIRAAGGFVAVREKASVEPADGLGARDFAVGEAVRVDDWALGLRDGTVAEVLEPGLRYAVALADGTTAPFFFDRMLSSG